MLDSSLRERTSASATADSRAATAVRALLDWTLPQLVGLGLGEREDVRGAARGTLPHVVDLVLGDAHHLLQALAHPVDRVRDRGQLGNLAAQLVRLGPPLRAVGPRRLHIADARLQPAREDLDLGGCGLTRGDGCAQLCAEHVDLLIDLGTVVATPDDGELGLVGNGHRGDLSNYGVGAGDACPGLLLGTETALARE